MLVKKIAKPGPRYGRNPEERTISSWGRPDIVKLELCFKKKGEDWRREK